MANRDFRKNLLLALGSLGALSGAVTPNMSAMENVTDENHKKLDRILDNALLLFDGDKQYFDARWHSNWTRLHASEVCNEIKKLNINKNDLTNEEKSNLKLFVLKLTKWEIKKSNYGVEMTHPGITKTAEVETGTEYIDNLRQLNDIWKSYFKTNNNYEEVSKIIIDAENDIKRFIDKPLAWQKEPARDIKPDITKLDELIYQNA